MRWGAVLCEEGGSWVFTHRDGGGGEQEGQGGTCPTGQESHRRRVLIDVGAVGQVDEDGVHVLDICDDDGQVGQGGQRPGLVLILRRQKCTALGEEMLWTGTHAHSTHTCTHDIHMHKHVCTRAHMCSCTPMGMWKFKNSRTHTDL